MDQEARNEIEISQRAHKRLVSLLSRRGLSGWPANSPTGKIIASLIDKWTNMVTADLPKETQMVLIQSAIEAEILKDSAMENLIRLKAPDPRENPRAESQRRAYKDSLAAFKAYTDIIIRIANILTEGTQVRESSSLEEEFRKLSNAHKETL